MIAERFAGLKINRGLHWWAPLFLFFMIFVFLQKLYAYHFFYIEQFQLFSYTKYYFLACWSHPGGGMEYISHFILQFFILPYVGPLVVALLTSLFFFIFVILLKKILFTEKQYHLWLVSIFLTLLFLFQFLNFNYHLQGNLAFFLCLLVLLFLISVKNSLVKTVLVFIFTLLLFWIAGSISILFAISFSAIEIQSTGTYRKYINMLLLPAWAMFVSFLSVRYAFSNNFNMSFLPDMYYRVRLTPDSSIYLPWGFLIITLLALPFLKKYEWRVNSNLKLIIQSLFFTGVIIWGSINIPDRKFYAIQKFDYYARTRQWDKIVQDEENQHTSNYLFLNYLNLALANKGLLLQKMFCAEQNGVQGLEVSSENKRLIAPLLSDISYCIGDVATAQQYAFEGNQICQGAGSGRLLKRLAETAIIFHNYKVARKYLCLLEHTWYYKEWALKQQVNLANDVYRINSDFKFKESCLPQKNSRQFAKDFPEQLEQLFLINPDNNFAASYLQASYLLTKDLKSLAVFWDNQSLRGADRIELPDICQQALLAYYETKPEIWVTKGITNRTAILYKNYRAFLTQNSSKENVRALMKEHFGTTYWFYLQFNQQTQ